MLNDLFYGNRDIKNEYTEVGVKANKTGEAIHMPSTRQCNIRVDVEGLEDNTTISVKFEESNDGVTFSEIGTFPIPDSAHGILLAKYKSYIRYQLIVSGTNPNLDVIIRF